MPIQVRAPERQSRVASGISWSVAKEISCSGSRICKIFGEMTGYSSLNEDVGFAIVLSKYVKVVK